MTEPQETETARRMLARYGGASRAAEAATDHAMDHERGTHGRLYWEAVRRAILRLAADTVKDSRKG